MTRADAIARARQHFASGEFLENSRPPGRLPHRKPAAQTRAPRCAPIWSRICSRPLPQLDFATRLIESPSGKGPYLLADYREDASLPTVLTYGHGDVVDGMAGEWRDNLDPWRTTIKGERVYGRGTADNKGQHSINMSALAMVREARGGKLGFNAKFIIETGEEIGSPDLRKVCEGLREELKADLFLASDGPRLSAERPTIFLGCRGGLRIHLDVNLRDGGHHSGNWGGVLANAATILSGAIAALVDEKGRMQLEAFKPPRISNAIRAVLADVKVEPISRRAGAVAELGRGGAVAGGAALCLEHAGGAGDVGGQYRKPRECHSRRGACGAAIALRGRHQDRCGGRCRAKASPRQWLSDGRGDGRAELCRLAHRFRQPLDQLGGGVDPADHRQGAGDPAEFRRLAAQRRVLRRAGAADDLGAAFLSRLLAARAERAHPDAGDGGGARDHGRAVLGPRREGSAS